MGQARFIERLLGFGGRSEKAKVSAWWYWSKLLIAESDWWLWMKLRVWWLNAMSWYETWYKSISKVV